MVEQSLIDYIKSHINQYSPEQIKQSLIQGGWDQASIDEAFSVVLPPSPPTPAPAPLNPQHGTSDSGRPR
ncbi:MAG: hypothetical protein KAT35_05960, partial [Candidatus Aenigmarchaeota archaeon]|nr:hypothetical protein [Candidatus Aenigmarchaeota archaeon]